MTTQLLAAETGDDPLLVAQSLAGSRDAFGRIVERYQSLVCALAFSATGSVSRSEDLAQETFVTAWQQLGTLREPAKLRAWLCGVARNVIHADRRRLGREPVHQAAPLDDLEVPAIEPAPLAQVISDEEVALMWREIGRLPEIYREPLVLFYREHRSVAHVAAALELSEDTVMQRLSRGRKQLHERMLVFIETALDRTNPGKEFKLRVDATLPLLAVASQTGALASAKGALAKGGGLTVLALPFVGMLAALGVSWSSVQQAPDPGSRRFMRIWNILLWSSIGAFMLGLRGVAALGEQRHWDLQAILNGDVTVWCGYLVVLTTLLVVLYRRGAGDQSAPAGHSRGTLLGMYVASSAWMVGFAWLMGDRAAAWLITLATAGLAAWNLRQLRGRSGAAAHRLTFACHAALCGMLLLAVNLRVDRWVAPLYHVSRDEMQRLLPPATVHLLTVALVAWVALMLAVTAKSARRT